MRVIEYNEGIGEVWTAVLFVLVVIGLPLAFTLFLRWRGRRRTMLWSDESGNRIDPPARNGE